tara:strand:+ start:388 stop:597 length:210 start_codon:yes stop_codon:yes gene_type:complete
MLKLFYIYILFFLIIFPKSVLAYVGPGMSGGFILAVCGIFIAIFFGIFGVIYYPIKRIINKRKKNKKIE